MRFYQTAIAAALFICFTGFISIGLTAAINAQEQSANQWQYTLEQPSEGWQNADFDDRDWKSGAGGFGNRQAPSSPVQTNWNTSDIWLRKTFDIEQLPDKPALMIYHDEDVEVFINGQQVLSLPGYTNQYIVESIPAEQSKTLKPGQNLMAVHCKQTTGGQFIDVHFCDADNPPERPSTPLFKSDLITQWGESVTAENAWREYPRPQLMRTEWINLNGHWDYAVTANDVTSTPEKWDGKILVPFCLESKLGGVQKRLTANQSLWVQRTFNATPIAGRRMILNFEAVDYRSEVFVNGNSVGQHVGGNTPFSFDISDSIKVGENQLIVRVEDETEGWQLRGKQVINAEGIWYTQVSGIWQTVWMESVPNSYLADLKILTDAATGEIRVLPEIENRDAVRSVRVVVKDGGQFVTEATGGSDEISLKIENAKLWSPKSPHLYDLEITLLDSGGNVVDQVISYTGIRTVGKARDADGHLRMTLNGKSIFHWGPLDQGW